MTLHLISLYVPQTKSKEDEKEAGSAIISTAVEEYDCTLQHHNWEQVQTLLEDIINPMGKQDTTPITIRAERILKELGTYK